MRTKAKSKSVSAVGPNSAGTEDTQITPVERNSIVRMPDLCKMLGISRSAAYAKMQPSSQYFDPRFPNRIKVGERSVGWILGEVVEYIKCLDRI